MKQRTSGIWLVAAAILAALLIGFGLNLLSSQRSSRDDLLQRFTDSASNNASLTSALFSSVSTSSGQQLTKSLGGDAVSQAAIQAQVKQGNSPYGAVVSDKGRLLAASSDAPPSALARIAKLPDFVKQALGAQSYGVSDVTQTSNGRTIEFATGFTAADSSRRAVVTAIDPLVLTGFLGAYLKETKQLKGGDAYITDSNGAVIASTDPSSNAGEPIADPTLLDRALRQEQGEYGNRSFASVHVQGTSWRVVETAPSSVLLSSVRGTNKWVPWLIFAAFALAAIAALMLLRRTLTNARRLKDANEELAETNAQLEQRAQELLRSNEELEQFASIASHDLSEPLRKVQMFSKQLQATEGDNLSEAGHDYVARMIGAAERMETLIQDLLEFSRVTTRGREFSEVDLGEVFRATVADLEPVITEAGATIEVGALPAIQADPLQMRQLAQNLVSNAVKFRRDGVPPVVRVDGEVADGKVRIAVADNGIGFDERYSMRIFRVFERLHGRGEYPGTGIGLALCRKIAERHGGGIVAEGRPGEGATFTVTLPVRQHGRVHSNEVPSPPPPPTDRAKEPVGAVK